MRQLIGSDSRHIADQDRRLVPTIRTLLVVVWALVATNVLASEITFDADGSRNVNCACIAATSGCTSRFFDAAAGSQRHEWVTTAHALKGNKLDLTMYCYRKRDVTGEGNGLCCKGSSEAESLKMFMGELQK